MFKPEYQTEECLILDIHLAMLEMRDFKHFKCLDHDNKDYIVLDKDNYNKPNIFPRVIKLKGDRFD